MDLITMPTTPHDAWTSEETGNLDLSLPELQKITKWL